ncbi:sugar transferase (PEP-CTERM/EpsH1 system associated) [Hephaestia caeni]|uniref:Sugar transferase (PEP-CTERM/EpsH1 system associated) n=1 Tax=Hephaestia caeni TaxID=645617 RepID=A0A397PIV5_9SPHN|nr:sugar transferase (PEP-CTERM/EpsH1 system associated) [Hephaestia caeni]
MELLFLAHRVPYPPDRGDKIRSFHLLKHLSARAKVHLVAFTDDDRDLAHRDALTPWTATRTLVPRRKGQARAAIEALATGKPVSLTAFADPAVSAACADILSTHPIDTIFCFSGQMAQYLPARAQRVIMDFVDVDSAKFAGYADDARVPMAWMMRREARLLGAFERAISARADVSLFVSEAEAALFRGGGGKGRVIAIENGIDTVRFDPEAAFESVAAPRPLIAFTGQMDYRPNMEAVRWFAEDILPLIRRTHDATFAIVGRNPDPAVTALVSPHVIVTGEVADVRGWLAAASAVVAPLRLARGVQNKVLEAMAMARPVVASAAAAEGIDHDGTIRTGRDADAIADAVTSLLGNSADAAALGVAARARVIARYGWSARLAPLDALLGLDARRNAA